MCAIIYLLIPASRRRGCVNKNNISLFIILKNKNYKLSTRVLPVCLLKLFSTNEQHLRVRCFNFALGYSPSFFSPDSLQYHLPKPCPIVCSLFYIKGLATSNKSLNVFIKSSAISCVGKDKAYLHLLKVHTLK